MTENEAIKVINDKYETFFALSTTNDFDMAMATAIKALEEIQQYRAIGTVEEFKALKEKSTKKRFSIFESHGIRQFVCSCCDRPIRTTDNYCSFCGQKLDWQ